MVRKAIEREGALKPMSFRATDDLRRRLEDAASRSGRSLTAELEERLQRSFVHDELRDYLESQLTNSLARMEAIGRVWARIADLELENGELKARLKEATERQLVAA